VILITITVSLMAVTGFIAWLLARRWPRVDLTAPSLSDATVRAQAPSRRGSRSPLPAPSSFSAPLVCSR
jgi:hypothetical protein